MFEFFEEMEIDMTALGISTLIMIIMFVFIIQDPMKAGMDKIPIVTRIIALVVGWIGSYFVGYYMVNK